MRPLLRHLWHICFFPLLLWLVGFAWFISLIPWQPINDHLNTDAIVVLTGGPGRIERGLELLADSRADFMFISGVENNVTLPLLLHQKENRELASRVAQDHITLGYKAHNTVGNAQETAEWVSEHHIKTIRLITANIHMPRSLYELSIAIPQVKIIAEPVFSYHPERSAFAQSLLTLRMMISEYDKSIATVLKHAVVEL